MFFKANNFVSRYLCILIAYTILHSGLIVEFSDLNSAYAQQFDMAVSTRLVQLSENYELPLLRGIKFDPTNPFVMDFIVDKGDSLVVKEEETAKLVRYFLTALTVAEDKLWVNLSPYEKERVLDESLANTELGETLLEQDYLLKQLASSLTYPETNIGHKYWNGMAGLQSASSSLDKIWISTDSVDLYDGSNTVFIKNAKLKVETAADYHGKDDSAGASNVIRDVLIPEIANDVNEGKNFAQLRQLYYSAILAQWFKKKFANSLYSFYYNSQKTTGVDLADPQIKDSVFARYVEAFEQGTYSYTKKERDINTNRLVKRNYFSGGADASLKNAKVISSPIGDEFLDRDYSLFKSEGSAYITDEDGHSTRLSDLDDLLTNNGKPWKTEDDFGSSALMQDARFLATEIYLWEKENINRHISGRTYETELAELFGELLTDYADSKDSVTDIMPLLYLLKDDFPFAVKSYVQLNAVDFSKAFSILQHSKVGLNDAQAWMDILGKDKYAELKILRGSSESMVDAELAEILRDEDIYDLIVEEIPHVLDDLQTKQEAAQEDLALEIIDSINEMHKYLGKSAEKVRTNYTRSKLLDVLGFKKINQARQEAAVKASTETLINIAMLNAQSGRELASVVYSVWELIEKETLAAFMEKMSYMPETRSILDYFNANELDLKEAESWSEYIEDEFLLSGLNKVDIAESLETLSDMIVDLDIKNAQLLAKGVHVVSSALTREFKTQLEIIMADYKEQKMTAELAPGLITQVSLFSAAVSALIWGYELFTAPLAGEISLGDIGVSLSTVGFVVGQLMLLSYGRYYMLDHERAAFKESLSKDLVNAIDSSEDLAVFAYLASNFAMQDKTKEIAATLETVDSDMQTLVDTIKVSDAYSLTQMDTYEDFIKASKLRRFNGFIASQNKPDLSSSALLFDSKERDLYEELSDMVNQNKAKQIREKLTSINTKEHIAKFLKNANNIEEVATKIYVRWPFVRHGVISQSLGVLAQSGDVDNMKLVKMIYKYFDNRDQDVDDLSAWGAILSDGHRAHIKRAYKLSYHYGSMSVYAQNDGVSRDIMAALEFILGDIAKMKDEKKSWLSKIKLNDFINVKFNPGAKELYAQELKKMLFFVKKAEDFAIVASLLEIFGYAEVLEEFILTYEGDNRQMEALMDKVLESEEGLIFHQDFWGDFLSNETRKMLNQVKKASSSSLGQENFWNNFEAYDENKDLTLGDILSTKQKTLLLIVSTLALIFALRGMMDSINTAEEKKNNSQIEVQDNVKSDTLGGIDLAGSLDTISVAESTIDIVVSKKQASMIAGLTFSFVGDVKTLPLRQIIGVPALI